MDYIYNMNYIIYEWWHK